MLFTSREVRIGKNCARRLGYRPRAVSKTEGTVLVDRKWGFWLIDLGNFQNLDNFHF